MIFEWLLLTIRFLPATLPLLFVGVALEVWLLSRRDPDARRPMWKFAVTLGSSIVLASFFAAQIVVLEIVPLVEPIVVYLASLPVLQIVLFVWIAYGCGLFRAPEKSRGLEAAGE